ncbi:MAG: 3-deoxy-manno-octulosonate cytidylyltransferase [Ignavibacteria bacterium]|nr:3-deoxy-manno-octulosonate cytidylyltransferase [Ignavibacteria bacterium]
MIITGIIPARYDSTRFPGKPMADIAGKKMIQRVYEQTLKSKLINKVYVATDDRRIYDFIKSFGWNAIMTSSKHKTGTDRLCEAAKKIKTDIVVNIQGDEPFINPQVIDDAIAPLLKEKQLNVSTLACRFKVLTDVYDPNKVKVVFDGKGNALYFSRAVVPLNFKTIKDIIYYKHLGLYVYRKNFLLKFNKTAQSMPERAESLEQLRMLAMGEKIRVVITTKDSLSVDTEEDIIRILKHIKSRGKK